MVNHDLAEDLRRAGLRPGATVLAHCSLHEVGWLPDGPATLRRALQRVLTPGGTLVVPTHTAGNSNTSDQYRRATAGKSAAARAAWEDAIEPFDPDTSPSHEMGLLAEDVRRHPGTLRSRHPHTSFSALGPRARELTAVHDLDCHLGERSPVGALYAADATVLMIGVGYDHCTAFHLAEYRLPTPPRRRAHRCYVRDERGGRRRVDFLAPHLDDHDFPLLGAAFEGTGVVRAGRVGNARTRLFEIRAAVDFAVGWMTEHRGRSPGCPDSPAVDIVNLHR
ncbi:aminoglycoside N(3)-acetyltransferase [Actinoplanes teichomyceticus]|uniref:Aminoglycoside N(3)-acetyltransferase n=1 Tax=Actinoplanes teichomyceticus TaxID=1867 RepID=A0A561VLL0_ACTTI|nr:AAC(3) family N-acetyltransferase [Actinoplanes teichomyceticus]TWG12506.1 aminoglycoside 3-N-acetyltransferase [Actinoplanes teichomyceticus]GIF13870.1 AAC(3) family N-acetyltransferase [Actinoplanes teichomyceticus]